MTPERLDELEALLLKGDNSWIFQTSRMLMAEVRALQARLATAHRAGRIEALREVARWSADLVERETY